MYLKTKPQDGLKENRRISNVEYRMSKEGILSILTTELVRQSLDTIFFLFCGSNAGHKD